MNDQLASVYGLKDRRDDEIFYIGMSIDPYARYGQHLAMRIAKDAKEVRILDMRKEGLMPDLVIIEQDIPIDNAYKRERYWIQYHLDLGIQLTNSRLGYSSETEQPKYEPDIDRSIKWIAHYEADEILWPFRDGNRPECVLNFAYKKCIRRCKTATGANAYCRRDVILYRNMLIKKGKLPSMAKEAN